jgi:glycosyltransferase involved in cell wall biosynthesis
VTDQTDQHVVMIVANDVHTDTRVKKEALALAQGGLRVTIVGIVSQTCPSSTRMGPVRIVRIPVQFSDREPLLRRTADRWQESHTRLQARQRRAAKRTPVRAERWVPVRKARSAVRRVKRRALRTAAASLGSGEAALRRVDARWGRVRGWRWIHPQVLDFEAAFGPVIVQLAPDVIHAHDMHLVGVAARARAAVRDRAVPWVYDAHEYVAGLSQYGGRTASVIAGWADLEAEFIRDAARVITVSPAIADALERRYALPRKPAVVLNVPTMNPPDQDAVTPLRDVCGLTDDVPLITYSGGITSARGVDTAITAMAALPEVHLALVCVPHNDTWYVRKMRQLAATLGVADRVHFVNPVSPGQVVGFLRGVDVGLIPGLSFPSHEMSLPNKLFEYLHAGVPIVCSELESLGAFVREHGVGVTFPPGDADGLAAAVRKVLEGNQRYRSACEDAELLRRYSWSEQADELRRVYSGLLGRPLVVPDTGEAPLHEVVDLTEVAPEPAEAALKAGRP